MDKEVVHIDSGNLSAIKIEGNNLVKIFLNHSKSVYLLLTEILIGSVVIL